MVAENVDALEMCLVKSKKLLKEALKSQTKMLTCLTKQKMTLEKTQLSKKTQDETHEALSQTTEQLNWARPTVTQHTADIPHIESLLEGCESMDKESSFSGAENPPAAIPQGQEDEDPDDIEMRDVEYDPNPPSPSEQDDDQLPVPAVQSDPPPEDKGDCHDTKDSRDVIIEDERIIIETGGATPITPAEDQLLDDQGGTGVETPSGAVTKTLSQMSMDSPTTPPGEGQDA